MNNLILEKTDNTPGVVLDFTKRTIEFTGDSRPENAKLFFDPIFNWISEYSCHIYFLTKESNSEIKTNVNFKLEYFNSSSAKYIVEIIKAFNKAETENPKAKITINWNYDKDDDDLRDSGAEFVKMTGVEMNFISN